MRDSSLLRRLYRYGETWQIHFLCGASVSTGPEEFAPRNKSRYEQKYRHPLRNVYLLVAEQQPNHYEDCSDDTDHSGEQIE